MGLLNGLVRCYLEIKVLIESVEVNCVYGVSNVFDIVVCGYFFYIKVKEDLDKVKKEIKKFKREIEKKEEKFGDYKKCLKF